jgi:phosphate transport system substrate-binding protein
MMAFKPRCIVRLALLCGFALPSLFGQTPVRKLYVEGFTTRAGSEQLRGEVIAELRKLGSVSLVSNGSGADVILGGGGEIWVQGYRSLNPRSGPSPKNGSPLYGGFLAVELRDTKGETLWSYLATPGGRAGDILKDLSKQIAKHVAEALAQDAAPAAAVPLPQPGAVLEGAGATFPYPVYAKWITNYRRVNPNIEISYDSVGSEAGVRRLLAGEIDFGASDNPEAIHQLAPAEEDKYLLFPSVVGAVVPIVNLPGFPGEIAFTPEILAEIYLGRIRKWNDPALLRANPRLRLPAVDIVVVHRSDGSGTSYAWTDYLSQTNPEWKAEYGASLTPHWPVGRGATGNEGVAALVKELGGSIGYVEFIYALDKHLSYGSVRNANGEFVSASLESIGVAAKQTMEISDDLKISLVNAPGAGAYPISSFTWLVVPAHIPDETKRSAIKGFLKWIIGPGQRQAAALGYLALPKDLIGKEAAAVDRIK